MSLGLIGIVEKKYTKFFLGGVMMVSVYRFLS